MQVWFKPTKLSYLPLTEVGGKIRVMLQPGKPGALAQLSLSNFLVVKKFQAR